MFGSPSFAPEVGGGYGHPGFHLVLPKGEVPGPLIGSSPTRQHEGSRGIPSYLTDLSFVNRKRDLDYEKRLKKYANLT